MNREDDTAMPVTPATAAKPTALDQLEHGILRIGSMLKVQNALLEGIFAEAMEVTVQERDNSALCFVGQELEREYQALDTLFYQLFNAEARAGWGR